MLVLVVNKLGVDWLRWDGKVKLYDTIMMIMLIWSRFIEQKSEETGCSPPSCPPPGWTWPSACRRCPPCATSRRCCLTPGQDSFGRVGSVWRRKGHLHLFNITLDEDRHRPNILHIDDIPGFKSGEIFITWRITDQRKDGDHWKVKEKCRR